ncbi:MAG: hypothetical protein IPK76_04995 [Lewinellaceae bacterium]|nr:hypothetical protein [Lewinellaceae bacterium]
MKDFRQRLFFFQGRANQTKPVFERRYFAILWNAPSLSKNELWSKILPTEGLAGTVEIFKVAASDHKNYRSDEMPTYKNLRPFI